MADDLLSLLAQETGTASKVVAAVSSDQLTAPTPCAGFDLRALINHMCMGNHFIAEVLAGKDVLPDYESDFVRDDHSSAYERSRDAVLAAASVPDVLDRTVPFPGTPGVPAEFAIAFVTLEAIVHRWDAAKAIGADPAIDPAVADIVLGRIRPMIVDELRAPSPEETTPTIPFGPQVEVPESADGTERLLAFTGRTP